MSPNLLLRWFFAACPCYALARGTDESISINDSVVVGSHVTLLQQHAELVTSTLVSDSHAADSVQKTIKKKDIAVVYMASGQKYIYAAFSAATSVKLVMQRAGAGVSDVPNISIVLYTDEPMPTGIASAPFDSVNTDVVSNLIRKYDNNRKMALRASKIHSIKDALAKHDYVIYLDSDTKVCNANLVLGVISALDMGAHLAGVPEAAVRDWMRLDSGVIASPYLSPSGVHSQAILPTPITVHEINGGMLGARSADETHHLFELWADYHAKSSRNETCTYANPADAGRDQKPLMCALNASSTSIAYMSGGYNCKSLNNYVNGTDWNESPTYCGMEGDLWTTAFNSSGVMSTTCFLVHGQNVWPE